MRRDPRHRESGRRYSLTVAVTEAARAKQDGKLSCTDCAEPLGEAMTVMLTFRRGAVPRAGDRVTYSRPALDGFATDGEFAGTTVTTPLIKLNKKKP